MKLSRSVMFRRACRPIARRRRWNRRDPNPGSAGRNRPTRAPMMKNYNQSINLVGALALCADLLLALAACGQIPPLKVTILQGQQFAHRVQLPSTFHRPQHDSGPPFDHYSFRLAASSPDLLLIAACRYENPSRQQEVEFCSANSFVIDTTHSYTVQEAKQSDWERALQIDGFLEMDDPVHRTLKRELAKPSALRALPLGTEVERDGYKYGGKPYLRRSKWMTALNFGDSADRKLIVLAGYDRNKLSHGPFALDVFDSDPSRRIAAIDAESPTWVEDRLRRISIVNSRWLVIGLDLDLRQMLLFDFNSPAGEQNK